MLEEFRTWGPFILFWLSIFAGWIGWRNYKDRLAKEEADKQKALDAKIQELRDHADKKLEDSIDNTQRELREIKDCLTIIQTRQGEQNARQAEQYVMVKMFEDYVKTTIAESLKSFPTETEKDVLLAKFSNDSLTRDEVYLLREYMYAERKAKSISDRAIFSTYDAMIIMLSLNIERLERKQKANEPCNIS
jgi:ElaB/YqjD/DUF883 family membrane-anchored ribosome-binding protein